MKKIILASASPRRKEILEITGMEFEVCPGDYEEDLNLSMHPEELSRFLSRKKAECVSDKHDNAIIIAADTFISFNDKILGKPHNEKEAEKMLVMLSGEKHSVITGFTVLDTGSNKIMSKSVVTNVYLRTLTSSEITAYIKSKEPLDKAGAYAIQGLGAVFIEKIEGDYFNVVGLPLFALAECLKKFGISVL